MTFSQSFTGKGTASIIPESKALSAQAGLNEMVTKAEELKFRVYKTNEAEFLKNAQIDPVFVLSDSARRYQMELINDFNKKWGKRAQETNYNLTMDDKQQMLTEKNFITSEAQGQKAQMDMFLQHRDLVAKNPGLYDVNDFALKAQDYMRNGSYIQTMPEYKELDFGNWIRGEASKEPLITGKMVPVGRGKEALESFTVAESDVGRYIASKLTQNPQAQKNFFRRWNEADKEKWFGLADENNDKIIDDSEKQNAILLWAENEFGKDVRQRKLTNVRAAAGVATKATGSVISTLKAGQPVDTKRYGETTYRDSYQFEAEKVVRNVNTTGGRVIYSDVDYELESGNVSGRLLLYNPDKDVLVFETVGSSESAETKGQTIVEVPANNIMDIDNISIIVKGKQTTIGELRKNISQPDYGTPKKKTYNPETGQFEFALPEKVSKRP